MSSFLKNIYIQALAGTLVTLLFIFLYDKFEKKDFTKVEYVKFACLSYFSCLASLYFSAYFNSSTNCPVISSGACPIKINTESKIMSGGSSSNNSTNINNSNVNSNANNIMNDTSNLERFKTGNPGF